MLCGVRLSGSGDDRMKNGWGRISGLVRTSCARVDGWRPRLESRHGLPVSHGGGIGEDDRGQIAGCCVAAQCHWRRSERTAGRRTDGRWRGVGGEREYVQKAGRAPSPSSDVPSARRRRRPVAPSAWRPLRGRLTGPRTTAAPSVRAPSRDVARPSPTRPTDSLGASCVLIRAVLRPHMCLCQRALRRRCYKPPRYR